MEGGKKTIIDIEKRLDLIYSLQKKHSVNSVKELIGVMESLKDKISKNESVIIDIDNLKDEIQKKNLY